MRTSSEQDRVIPQEKSRCFVGLALDAVLMKKYASSFFGTDLAARLNAQRSDTVIITVASTSGCVRATAVDAIQNG